VGSEMCIRDRQRADGAGLTIDADGNTITLLNNVGAGHGLTIGPESTTLSGGTSSSVLTLNNDDANITINGSNMFNLDQAGATTSLGVAGVTNNTITGANNYITGSTSSVISGGTSSMTLDDNGVAIAGNTGITGTLTVSGATHLNDSLTVEGITTLNGATTINNTLNVTGATDLDGTLNVDGLTTTHGITNSQGITNTGGLTTDTLHVTGDSILDGHLTVDGGADISSSDGTGTLIVRNNKSSIGQEGTIADSFYGLNATDSRVRVGYYVDGSDPSTFHGLTVTDDTTTLTGGTSSSSLTLADSAATLKVGTADSPDEVRVIRGTATYDSGSGDTTSHIYIGSNDNIQNDIMATASGGVNNLTANLYDGTNNIEAHTNNIGVSTANSVNNIGNSTSTNTITGDTNTITGMTSTTISGGSSSMTLDNNGVAIDGNTGITGTLTVSGATLLNDSLTVEGTTTLNGATTINNTLAVNGDTNLTGALSVFDDGPNFTTSLEVNGDTGLSAYVLDTGNGAAGMGLGSVTTPLGSTTTGAYIGYDNQDTDTMYGLFADSESVNVGYLDYTNTSEPVYHGLNVTDSQTTLSGGANSSAWTLTDGNAALAVDGTELVDATNTGSVTTVTIGDTDNNYVEVDSVRGTVVHGPINVTGAADFDSTLNVDGATTLQSTLLVNGATTIDDTLHVTGATDLDSTLNVDGATTLQSTLLVNGATTIDDTLHVTGATDLDSTLNVDGATTLQSTLLVNGATTIDDTLHVTGATTLDSSLTVAGTTTLNGSLNVLGPTTTTGLTNNGYLTSNGGDVHLDTNAGQPGNASLSLVDDDSANLLYTNSLGNTHGLTVGETQTVLSGGRTSTSLTLNNYGATFSNSLTGPARVTGVADGVSDWDAVNYRQLRKAYEGIAAVSALSAIPGTLPGKKFAIGAGYGYFESESAVAVGMKAVIMDKVSVSAGVGIGVSDKYSDFSANAGISYSF
jgi:hypothetical protein